MQGILAGLICPVDLYVKGLVLERESGHKVIYRKLIPFTFYMKLKSVYHSAKVQNLKTNKTKVRQRPDKGQRLTTYCQY